MNITHYLEGWWSYDSRSNQEIEESYDSKKPNTFDILICGEIYTLDFGQMVQYMKNNPTRKRRIRRERKGFHMKGVAGILNSQRH